LMADGQIGGVIGYRGKYVRFISYCVGRGVSDSVGKVGGNWSIH
jgi:hypothetical protein